MKAKDLTEENKIYRIITRDGKSVVSIFKVRKNSPDILEGEKIQTIECDMESVSFGSVKEGIHHFQFRQDDEMAVDENKVPYDGSILSIEEFYFKEDDLRAAVDRIYAPQLVKLKTEVEKIEGAIEVIDEMLKERKEKV